MERERLNGTVLKIIAIVTMLIDHIGAVLVRPYALSVGLTNLSLQGMGQLESHVGLAYTYTAMRMIGRIAFPIFAFFIVEGIMHTSNLMKYAGRLFVFGLISEIPFDLAVQHRILEFTYQNVMFTLFLGVLACWGFETIARQLAIEPTKKVGFLPTFLAILMAIMAIFLAEVLYTDYGGIGVMVILIMYLARNNRNTQLLVGGMALVFTNPVAILGLVPIYFYDGERGKGLKYFFYGFYPVHLLLLYVILQVLGLAQFG